MPPMAFNPKTTDTITSIEYMVNTTGDALFNSNVASSDSPDYTECSVEANEICLKLNPLAVEVVA